MVSKQLCFYFAVMLHYLIIRFVVNVELYCLKTKENKFIFSHKIIDLSCDWICSAFNFEKNQEDLFCLYNEL